MRPSDHNGGTLTVLTRSRTSCYPHCIGLGTLFWLFCVSLLLATANEKHSSTLIVKSRGKYSFMTSWLASGKYM